MRQAKIFLFNVNHNCVARIVRDCALVILFAAFPQVINGQQPSTSAPPPPAKPAEKIANRPHVAQQDDRYRIGPGDVLDIRVFNRPQLSRESVRVDGHGKIRMPLIEEEIQAACRTEAEVAREIATRYLEYQRNPQVDVFVKEYQSQPVAVIGAVKSAGRFQLQRRVRLLELLTFVGGPSEVAGRSIQIVHTMPGPMCEDQGPENGVDDATSGLVFYDLNDTLHGVEKANPYVRPGDIVSILEAEQIYIIGNVVRPAPIPLKERITVSRAIALAGGTLPDSKSDRVRLIRQPPGSTTRTEILLDLKAIDKRKAEDVVLQANDVVEVPREGGVLKGIVRTVVPAAATQLPLRVIP